MSVETFVSPTSFAQQRLWFVDQLEPGSPLYHVPMVLSLRGPLDVGALRHSLATIVARHEALRTTFTVLDGEPMQVIASAQETPLPLTDLSGLPPEQRETEQRGIITGDITAGFDLSRGPLFRAHLVRMSSDEHVLVLVVHHIVFDGWSAGVLSRELCACYRAYAAGEPPRLPELPVQYADYAVWQREWLTGEVLERQLAYWRAQLAGVPTVLDLATDLRPNGASQRGATETVVLPAALLDGLKGLGRTEQATLFMTLLAAFQALLGRYTGRDDFVVGCPIANRNRAELEPLIGFFVNSLPLRASLSGNPTFRQLLGRVRESALGAYAHQDVPFERVVEDLQPERAADRNPLFQVMFALQNAPHPRLDLAGLTVRRLPLGAVTAKFDLTLHASEEARGLRARMEYRVDLFEASTIRRTLGHFEALVRGILADPDRRLGSIPLLTPGERSVVVDEWNRTERHYPGQLCLQTLFEEQARTRPAAIAVESRRERLSYAELNRRANQLARHLRRQGVDPEARVGVALERSTDLIVTLLGVLKAGGAYVPLDPGCPAERIGFMLADAQVAAVVTNGRRPDGIPPGVPVVDLQAEQSRLAGQSDADPEPVGSSELLACVMYTFDSSPKGVGIPHRAVTRLVCDTDYVRLGPTHCVAQVSNASSDTLNFEVWGALLCGARLAVIDQDVTLSPGAFMAELRDRGVTTVFLSASLLDQVADEVPDLLASGGQVLFGGEAVDPRRVAAMLRAGPPGRLLNLYGPTEATTFATWQEVDATAATAPSVPIGRPIANTRAYVLDRRLEPVPIGIPGELYLGGPGLARGYLGRPALTAQRFLPDPFGTPGGRLYRTGDRVRWRADGSLEFLGRLDEQVKLRGFRIELGAIETLLAEHPEVGECAVAVRTDGAGGQTLVAFVTSGAAAQAGSNGSAGSAGATSQLPANLRAYLRERVPEFMIPSAFVVVQALPLSSNGKVDRRTLLATASGRQELEAPSSPPRTPVEKELARLWRNLLGVDQIGLRDDFFELGGHSLLAVKLFAEIERTFQTSLPLATLFQAPTLGQLAARLAGADGGSPGAEPVAVPPAAAPRAPLFVLHLHYGHVMEYRHLVNRLQPTQAVLSCEIPVGEQGGPILRTIEGLAAYHIRELRRQQPTGPYSLCGYCWAGSLAFEMARQLQAAGEEVGLLALIDCPYPGSDRGQALQRRASKRVRKVRKLVVDNLHRIRELEPRRIPGFLWERLVNIVTRIAGAPAFRLSVRLGRPLLPAFRDMRGSLLHAAWAYRPRTYPGRITFFRATDVRFQRGVDRGWAEVAGGGVEVYDMPGDHDTIVQEPHVQLLSRQLLACLERANAAGGPR